MGEKQDVSCPWCEHQFEISRSLLLGVGIVKCPECSNRSDVWGDGDIGPVVSMYLTKIIERDTNPALI